MAGVPATVTRTGTLIPVVPGALMAMAALKVPEPCSAPGLTVTWSVLGRLPDAGVTVSQFPPLLVTGVAVNEVALELLLETVRGCVAGTVLLAPKLKLSDVGLVNSGLGPPEGAGLNCTATDTNPAEELILINPTSLLEEGAPGPTETETVSGVTPLAGETISQLLLEKAEIVTFAGPLVEAICKGCAGAFVLLKVSCDGKTVMELLCARTVAIQHSSAGSRTARRNKDLSEIFTIFSTCIGNWVRKGRGGQRNLGNRSATNYRPRRSR